MPLPEDENMLETGYCYCCWLYMLRVNEVVFLASRRDAGRGGVTEPQRHHRLGTAPGPTPRFVGAEVVGTTSHPLTRCRELSATAQFAGNYNFVPEAFTPENTAVNSSPGFFESSTPTKHH